MVTATAVGGRVVEGASSWKGGEFAIELSAPLPNAVSIPWRIVSASAIEADDFRGYYYLEGTTAFAAGETRKTINAGINGDVIPEPDEALVLQIFSATGIDLPGRGARHDAALWIQDDDGHPSPLSLWASSPVVVEGNGRTQGAFTLSLSRTAERDYEIPYRLVGQSATEGKDFAKLAGTAIIPRGTSEATIPFAVLGDRVAEGLEHAQLRFDLPSGIARATGGRLTIVDDDHGAQAVVLTAPSILPEGASSWSGMTFVISLSQPATSAVSVPWRIEPGTATTDVDYRGYYYLSGTATFSPGQTMKTVNVGVNGDTVPEPDESVVFVVSKPTGPAILPGQVSQMQTVGWIHDDDGAGKPLSLFVSSPHHREGNKGTSLMQFDLELSRPADKALSVRYATLDGSAKAGEDYVATSGSVRFEKGQQSATVNVKIVGETKYEGNETFTLRVIPDGAIAQTFGGRGTIENDDRITDYWVQTGTARGETIRGHEYRDKIRGMDGDDRIFGYGGNDHLDGGNGNDRLFGGAGNDKLWGRAGNDLLDGGLGNDVLYGGSGNDELQGRADNDTLYGGEGRDKLYGGSGDDTLHGGSGNDYLDGGTGRDVLRGGKGDDVLKGGDGRDVFVFGKDEGRDRILDFRDDFDVIQIVDGARRFGDLSLSRADGDTIVRFAGTMIVIEDQKPGAIGAEDFIFG